MKKPKKKTGTYQTGKTTIALDRKIQAKEPGMRTSKSGKKYYEARRNRSDIGKYL